MEANTLITLVLFILSVSLPKCVYSQIDDMKTQKEEMVQSTVIQNEDYVKVRQYLNNQVPEIAHEWEDYVKEKSEGKAYISTNFASFSLFDVYRDYEETEYLGKYYLIYVGEQWEDHSVLWAYFYVSENFDEVLWYDIVAGKESEYPVLYLDEWRKSDFYPKLDN